MDLSYSTTRKITIDAFVDLLNRSTLAERRPVGDREVLEGMLEHADLLCTAWQGEKLVGLARSVTDFSYCCYLSDLAVDGAFQGKGIGKALIRLTQQQLGPEANLILLSAPKAVDYYPKLGFSRHESAWVIGAREEIA